MDQANKIPIKIDPINRGLYYNGYDPDLGYDGDPVTIIGGLNPQSANPVGALATVGTVLKGSVKNIITSFISTNLMFIDINNIMIKTII